MATLQDQYGNKYEGTVEFSTGTFTGRNIRTGERVMMKRHRAGGWQQPEPIEATHERDPELDERVKRIQHAAGLSTPQDTDSTGSAEDTVAEPQADRVVQRATELARRVEQCDREKNSVTIAAAIKHGFTPINIATGRPIAASHDPALPERITRAKRMFEELGGKHRGRNKTTDPELKARIARALGDA